jgi:hypothetical protein
MSTTSLPKYVIVGGAQRLIAFNPIGETIPQGTYIPTRSDSGNIILINARMGAYNGTKTYTVHRDVWPVALADYRIMEA